MYARFTAMWPVLAWLAGGIATPIAVGHVAAIAQIAGIGTLVFLVQKLPNTVKTR